MSPKFTVRVDIPRSIATITLLGFFELADIASFERVRDTEYAKFRCARNQHVSLIDMREMAIQSQDVVAGFTQLLANPRYRSNALAFVVSKSLNRLQVQRASSGRTARYFTSLEEAQAWLSTLAPASLAA